MRIDAAGTHGGNAGALMRNYATMLFVFADNPFPPTTLERS